MFGLLKKKITGFIDNLTKKEEKKGEPEKPKKEIPEIKEKAQKEETPKIKEEPKVEKKPEVKKEKPKPVSKPKEPLKKVEKPKAPQKKVETPKEEPKPEVKRPVEKKAEPKKEEPVKEKPVEKKAPEKPKPVKEKPKPAPVKEELIPKKKVEKPVVEEKKVEEQVVEEKPAPVEEIPEIESQPEDIPKPVVEEAQEEVTVKEEPAPEPEPVEEKKEEKPKERIKLSPFSMIKSFVTSEVEISDNDVGEMLDNLELELLEGDVDMDVATSITAELREKLIGQKVKKKELHDFIKNAIRETLTDVMSTEGSFDLLSLMESSDKPVKIMFLGVNGSGKTTTIAKMMNLLQTNGYKVVVAAADTFRAAAIEQMGVHAERLGVKMIKRDYGADPTSVAYDAVSYAKAHDIDAVFIDTAGRQDTNVNLINELKKMNRVIEPDLKIYVGESIAGNAILEQLGTFHKEIEVNGVILTKLDCDPKGGTMLSISKSTGVPIVYIGTGQKYEDIERFDAREMADRIVGES